jgi:prolyl-tRNA editing enzyme YbaK/EbsC (Cys-tRNA(Pro) deacylase)
MTIASKLPSAAKKFQDAARFLGLDIQVREMVIPTRTAEQAASACGVSVGQIVKSLVFHGATSRRPYLLLVSGINRVSEKGVARHLGEALVRPDADSVRKLTGYSIGGVPPFGHDSQLATYMDQDLMRYDAIWAAAGTPQSVFRIGPANLQAATKATLIDVT